MPYGRPVPQLAQRSLLKLDQKTRLPDSNSIWSWNKVVFMRARGVLSSSRCKPRTWVSAIQRLLLIHERVTMPLNVSKYETKNQA